MIKELHVGETGQVKEFYLKKEANGYRLCMKTHTGDFYVPFYPVAPYKIRKRRLLEFRELVSTWGKYFKFNAGRNLSFNHHLNS